MPSNLKLFLLFGQSNMAGHGLVSEYPVGRPAHGEQIWNYGFDGVWRNNPVEPLHDLTDCEYPIFDIGVTYGVGPGLFFADHFARHHSGIEIGLVPCGVGGININKLARPGDGVDTTTIYGASRARWEAAAASGTVEGVIFYQGEADTTSTLVADAWAGKFAQFVTNIRSDTGRPDLPFVFVQVGPRAGRFLSRPDWPLLQSNQAKIVTTPRVAMVPNLDTALKPGDEVHLDTASQQVIGERIANMMRMLGACL